MPNRLLRNISRDQRGITGLETAIILIAFVVVASVFAYTVLSAGIFSSEKGKEAIFSGLESARSSMELVGTVVYKDNDADGSVDEIIFIISNALDGEALNLVTTVDADADGLLSDETNIVHATVVTYFDRDISLDDLAWLKTPIGKHAKNKKTAVLRRRSFLPKTCYVPDLR